jgi:hypothetical protein
VRDYLSFTSEVHLKCHRSALLTRDAARPRPPFEIDKNSSMTTNAWSLALFRVCTFTRVKFGCPVRVALHHSREVNRFTEECHGKKSHQ